MDLSIIKITKSTFVCSLSIVFTALTLYYLFTNYFLPYNSTWSPTLIMIIDGYVNGIIFGKNLNKSTAQLLVFFEIVFLIYLTFDFTFNPWGTATHVPFSLLNIPKLLLLVGIFGAFGLVFFGVIILNIAAFGSWGYGLRNRLLKHNDQEEVNQ